MFPVLKVIKTGMPSKYKTVSTSNVKKVLEAALRQVAKEQLNLFHEVDSTWRHKINVTITPITWTGGDAEITVMTDDEVFWWLDNGVPRHAIMSKDFVPKTVASKPARFKSGSGSGNPDPVAVTRFWSEWIDARNWTETMADNLNKSGHFENVVITLLKIYGIAK